MIVYMLSDITISVSRAFIITPLHYQPRSRALSSSIEHSIWAKQTEAFLLFYIYWIYMYMYNIYFIGFLRPFSSGMSGTDPSRLAVM